jgi:hypothetical protein
MCIDVSVSFPCVYLLGGLLPSFSLFNEMKPKVFAFSREKMLLIILHNFFVVIKRASWTLMQTYSSISDVRSKYNMICQNWSQTVL